MTEHDDPAYFFYADPVDENGNVIAKVTFTNARGPQGPITPIKVPASEIVLDPPEDDAP